MFYFRKYTVESITFYRHIFYDNIRVVEIKIE